MSMGSRRASGPGGESLLQSGPGFGGDVGMRAPSDAPPPGGGNAQGNAFAAKPFVPDADSTTPLSAAGSTRILDREGQNRSMADLLGTHESEVKAQQDAQDAAAAEEERKKIQQQQAMNSIWVNSGSDSPSAPSDSGVSDSGGSSESGGDGGW